MSSELSQRVKAALDEVRALGAADVRRHLQELSQTEPELASRLERLLREQPLGRAASEAAENRQLLTSRPEVRGELTVSSGPPATITFQPGAVTEPNVSGREEPANPNQLLGRYRLLRVVGEGGFGEVWHAYDSVLRKHVAVKKQLARGPGRSLQPTLFLNEARKAASLRHPAIVQVYDVGQTPDGAYIISEFVEGDSLSTRLAAGPLPFDKAARITAAIASGLHVAHLAGLVHRDVKTANILLDRHDNAYLTDFGLAIYEHEQPIERNKISGTLAYMSPEQIRGDTHLLDGRTDIYSLGAVFYEMLTGRRLFRAATHEEYQEMIGRREPRPPRSINDTVPLELERICLKCLAKEVKDRYGTAQDLARDLESWLALSARTSARPSPPAPPLWFKPALIGMTCLFFAAGIAGVAAWSGNLFGSRTQSIGVEPTVVSSPLDASIKRKPTVKELLWKRDETCKWEVLPTADKLKIYTRSTTLLQLGETDKTSWEFTANLGQLAPVGRIGLFLGYQKNPATGKATFELICLQSVNGSFYIQRSIETYLYAAPFLGTHGLLDGSVRVGDPATENTIRLVVRENRLSEVWLNGRMHPELVQGAERPPAAGPFGIFNRTSDGIVSNPLFNDLPIPLLTDANP